MKVGEFINKRRLALGLTLDEIGEAVGVGKSTVKKWETGFISNMKRDKIDSLAKVLKVNPSVFIQTDIDYDSATNPKSVPSGDFEITDTLKLYKKKVFGLASAGTGAFASDEVIGEVDIPFRNDREAEETICVTVDGDSMENRIHSGDIIAVRLGTPVEDGDIGAFLVDNESGFVKRYKSIPGGFELISENPIYKPMKFTAADTGRVYFYGKVVGVYSKM